MTTVSDILAVLHRMAPPKLAESWDSIGLQIGDPAAEVRNVLVALDPLESVITEACSRNSDLLVTHHPLLFKPASVIDFSTPLGRILRQASMHRLAVCCAHTNLDKAVGGTNDVLASVLGLEQLQVMVDPEAEQRFKVVVFVPETHENAFLDAVLASGIGGRIGSYRGCSFRVRGKGTFEPLDSARPFVGSIGQRSEVEEVRIEIVVDATHLADLLSVMRMHHPYETMAYDVYPLQAEVSGAGMGRVGRLPVEMPLETFARQLQDRMQLKGLHVVGDPQMPVRRVAVCTGSGSSLVRRFLRLDADVFVSGDLHYHDARDAEHAGKGLIDIGHFASEHLIVPDLARRLGEALADRGIRVEACMIEKDPFRWIGAEPA